MLCRLLLSYAMSAPIVLCSGSSYCAMLCRLLLSNAKSAPIVLCYVGSYCPMLCRCLLSSALSAPIVLCCVSSYYPMLCCLLLSFAMAAPIALCYKTEKNPKCSNFRLFLWNFGFVSNVNTVSLQAHRGAIIRAKERHAAIGLPSGLIIEPLTSANTT